MEILLDREINSAEWVRLRLQINVTSAEDKWEYTLIFFPPEEDKILHDATLLSQI